MYQPRSLPYGDIYKVPTSAVDNMANRLYAEQKQKEIQHQKEAQLLDSEFSKNVSKLRDADIPEYTKKYQDWKNARINLLKGKFKNNDEFIQAQLDAQRKLADWGSLGAKSIQAKEEEELYAKDYIAKPDKYDENAKNFFILRRNTPVTQFKVKVPNPRTGQVFDLDLEDIPSNTLYRGQNTDFTKTWKNVQGTRQLHGKEVVTPSEGGLTTTKTVFKAFNPPSKQFEILNDSRKGSSWERDFLINHDYSDEEANEIVAGYERLKQTPEFKAAYGDIPDIPQTAFASKLGRAMALSVMKNAQLNPPIAETKKPQQDIEAVMDRKWKEKLAFNKLTFGQSMQKIAANKAAGLPPEDLGYLSDNVADEYGVTETVKLGGNEMQRRVIYVDKVDPERLNVIIGKDKSKGKSGVPPIPIKQPDGTVRFGYYQDLGSGDWQGDKGQIISRERVKDDYINRYAPTKFKAGTGTKAKEKKNNNPLGLDL